MRSTVSSPMPPASGRTTSEKSAVVCDGRSFPLSYAEAACRLLAKHPQVHHGSDGAKPSENSGLARGPRAPHDAVRVFNLSTPPYVLLSEFSRGTSCERAPIELRSRLRPIRSDEAPDLRRGDPSPAALARTRQKPPLSPTKACTSASRALIRSIPPDDRGD